MSQALRDLMHLGDDDPKTPPVKPTVYITIKKKGPENHSVLFALENEPPYYTMDMPHTPHPEGEITTLVSAATLTAMALGHTVVETQIDYWEDRSGTHVKTHKPEDVIPHIPGRNQR